MGGGRGHLTRAVNLARLLGPAVILHQAEAAVPRAPVWVKQTRVEPPWTAASLRAAVLKWSGKAGLLVVDSFPAGLAHELDDEVLAAFPTCALVKRYVRPGSYRDYEKSASRFRWQLLPYQPGACEWEGTTCGTHVGLLVRRLMLKGPKTAPLVVIGDPATLPATWQSLLPVGTRSIQGPFWRLPVARRYLSLGAGYNTTYELWSLGASTRLVPRQRRYDDQFARADRLGLGLYSSAELGSWLDSGPEEG